MTSPQLHPAFFLDRDGVINVEVDYLSDPDKVVLIPGAAGAIRRLRAAGYLAIVTTNQSGVARGMYGAAEVQAVHRRIDELLAAEGAVIDGYYVCTHHPRFNGDCDCRKPAPGMLLQAAREHRIDLGRSAMVGDRLSDVGAGIAAGCAASYLVKTGYGAEVVRTQDIAGVAVAEDLADAVEQFLRRAAGR